MQPLVEDVCFPIPLRHAAAQDLVEKGKFDTLVIRAVAPLAKLLTWFNPHWDSFGRLLLVKGPAWVEERGAARERRLLQGLRLSKLATYPLPGTDSESVILEIRPRELESRR